MTTTTNVQNISNTGRGLVGPSIASLVPFECIQEPGTYVCTWSGHLMRVPVEALANEGGSWLNIVGPESLFVTKICDNPYISISKARILAANLDISVNF